MTRPMLTKLKPTKLLIASAAVLMLAACGKGEVTRTSIMVSDAWCRPSPNGATTGACYATIKTGQDDRLVSVSTPAAAAAAIHDMTTENGMMKMSEIEGRLTLKKGEVVTLAPGGKHLMLTGLTAPLVAGDTAVLTLTFEKAQPVNVDAVVRNPNDAAGKTTVQSAQSASADEHAAAH